MLATSLHECVTNSEVPRRTVENQLIMRTIERKISNWIGHVFKHDFIQKTIVKRKILGKTGPRKDENKSSRLPEDESKKL